VECVIFSGRPGSESCPRVYGSNDRAAHVMRGLTGVSVTEASAVRLSILRAGAGPAYQAGLLALFLAGTLGNAASVAWTVARALLRW